MVSPSGSSKAYKQELKQAIKTSKKEHKKNKRKRIDIANEDVEIARVGKVARSKIPKTQIPDIHSKNKSKPVNAKIEEQDDEFELALLLSKEEDFQRDIRIERELKVAKPLALFHIAEGELSQHSPKYQQLVGIKTNSDGSQEPVYFAVASCTPLAFSFASTAFESNKNGIYADMHTTSRILDAFLGDKEQVARGIAELKIMMDPDINPNTEITLNSMNLGGEHGLQLYNAMTQKNIVPKRYYNGDGENYFSYNHETNESDNGSSRNWYKKVLRDLKSGEGAVVVMGGYSVGVRRVRDAYEIFDSHNSNSYTKRQGACIIHCPNANLFEENLERIRSAGSAAALLGGQAEGIEVYVI